MIILYVGHRAHATAQHSALSDKFGFVCIFKIQNDTRGLLWSYIPLKALYSAPRPM